MNTDLRIGSGSLLAATLMLPSIAHAAFVLDGYRDTEYGAALAVQTVQTGFGDNLSELNAAYAKVSGGNLHLMLTGNLENNFNHLEIFIDSVAGGQNVISNDIDSGGTNPVNDGWADQFAGFTFDAGFTADYMLNARNGFAFSDRFVLDYAVLGTPDFESYDDVFSGSLTGASGVLGTTGIQVAFDNSNILGVSGGSGASDTMAAMTVPTGIELIIPLSAIGNPTGEIKISAMINGLAHDYLSNQFLGGLSSPQDNLGGPLSGIDLNNYSGNQFFTVAIPEPATSFFGALSALVLLRRHRKSNPSSCLVPTMRSHSAGL